MPLTVPTSESQRWRHALGPSSWSRTMNDRPGPPPAPRTGAAGGRPQRARLPGADHGHVGEGRLTISHGHSHRPRWAVTCLPSQAPPVRFQGQLAARPDQRDLLRGECQRYLQVQDQRIRCQQLLHPLLEYTCVACSAPSCRPGERTEQVDPELAVDAGVDSPRRPHQVLHVARTQRWSGSGRYLGQAGVRVCRNGTPPSPPPSRPAGPDHHPATACARPAPTRHQVAERAAAPTPGNGVWS